MDWIEAIRWWRLLTPEQQRDIRRRQLPTKVARSMAFAGQPVDVRMLEEELARLVRERDARSNTGGSTHDQ